MKYIIALVAILSLSGCALISQGPQTETLTHFEDFNFGIHFSHSPSVATHYNPHGSANRIGISWNDTPWGQLSIRPLPPEVDEEEFISAGKEYCKEQYGASSVDYRRHKNPHGYSFHHLKVEARVDGQSAVIERFVHLQDPKDAPSDLAPLQNLFGAFSFEFVYREEDSVDAEEELMTIIDSFRIKKDP